MLALLLSSLLSLFIFFVFGHLTARIFRFPSYIFDQLFLGLVALNTLVAVLSLIMPITYTLLLVVLLFCIMYLIVLGKTGTKMIPKIRGNKGTLLFFSLFLIMAFFVALGPQMNYDSGLYHVQAIKWIQEYPVIPGLANLHTRFGFNPNIFAVNAVMSLSHFFGEEIYSLNFTVFIILTFYYLKRLREISKICGISNFFFFYLFIFYDFLKLYPSLSSPTPDFLATALTYYILARIVDFALNEQAKSLIDFIPVSVLAVYLITVKLSTIPLLSLLVFLLIFYQPKYKIVLQSFLFFSVVLIPWIARNVILTGYLIFPLGLIDIFDFDWEIPQSKINIVENQIKGWARSPGPDHIIAAKLEIQRWFPAWWEDSYFYEKVLLLGGILAPVIFVVRQYMSSKRINPHFLMVMLTAVIGIIFWFFTAPDFRFGRAFLTVAFLSPLLVLQFDFKPAVGDVKIFAVALAVLTIQFFRITFLNNKEFLLNLPHTAVFQEKQQPDFLEFKTYYLEGVKVFVPSNGEKCFDHALPCADPYVDLRLIKLRKGTLKSGFKPISDI